MFQRVLDIARSVSRAQTAVSQLHRDTALSAALARVLYTNVFQNMQSCLRYLYTGDR
jgi:ribosomal protein L2